MTTTLDRPDPYSIKPRASGRRATKAGPSRPADPRLETMGEGLRAMTHERTDDAKRLLSSIATEEALAAGDPIAIDALAYLSSVVWTQKDPVTAIEMVERSLELGPVRFAPNQKGGEIAWRLGLLDKAEARFLAALRASDPGTGDAKAAERCLREVRKRQVRGIRHGTRGIGLDRLLRMVRPRKSIAKPARDTAQRTA